MLKAYHLFPRFTDTIEKARILDNLGYSLSKLKDSTGLSYMKRSLSLREKLNDSRSLYSSYYQLAKYYEDQKNDSIAKIYRHKAYDISKIINTAKDRRDALKLMTKFSSDSFAREFIRLNDSMEREKINADNSYALLKYNLDESEKKAQESRERMLYFAFLGGLILAVAVFLIILQRNRNKRHTLAQIHKTERNLSKKVHDELGNDIFYLMNQLETNPASLLEKEGLQILNGLNEIYVKARDISKKYTSIDTCEGYHDELLALLNSFGNATTKIVTNEIAPDFWQPVSTLKKEQLYRVLQELLTNMKKHSEAALVGITFTKIKKQIIVKYVDNGKGVTKEKLLTKGGLENVENRIAEIKGTITFDTSPDNGLKVEIRFIQ